jgi:hypothetical protein
VKHLKKFENTRIASIDISRYETPQQRSDPPKRRMDNEESKFMMDHMSNYAFSTIIDANGHIGLGGGMVRDDNEPRFMTYITEDDLINAMVKYRCEKAKHS